MVTPSCKKCRFVGVDYSDDYQEDVPVCRRRAPAARVSRDEDATPRYPRWPRVVVTTDWCGEFEPKPKG
jgi:hypothetical protein